MWDQKAAQFVADVLAMLNQNNTTHDDYYLEIKLVLADGTGSGCKAGEFSDEIAGDCWTFEPTVGA